MIYPPLPTGRSSSIDCVSDPEGSPWSPGTSPPLRKTNRLRARNEQRRSKQYGRFILKEIENRGGGGGRTRLIKTSAPIYINVVGHPIKAINNKIL